MKAEALSRLINYSILIFQRSVGTVHRVWQELCVTFNSQKSLVSKLKAKNVNYHHRMLHRRNLYDSMNKNGIGPSHIDKWRPNHTKYVYDCYWPKCDRRKWESQVKYIEKQYNHENKFSHVRIRTSKRETWQRQKQWQYSWSHLRLWVPKSNSPILGINSPDT